MSTNADSQIQVVDCGTKFDLLLQLSDLGRVRERPSFRLTIVCPGKWASKPPKMRIGVTVNGIEAEDGSGESWMITGYVLDTYLESAPLAQMLKDAFEGKGKSFYGLVNTRHRTGFIHAGVKQQ